MWWYLLVFKAIWEWVTYICKHLWEIILLLWDLNERNKPCQHSVENQLGIKWSNIENRLKWVPFYGNKQLFQTAFLTKSSLFKYALLGQIIMTSYHNLISGSSKLSKCLKILHTDNIQIKMIVITDIKCFLKLSSLDYLDEAIRKLKEKIIEKRCICSTRWQHR